MESTPHERAPRDPAVTDSEFYRVLWENDDVRVLEYRDLPGEETSPHDHPNSVLIALTDFHRRLSIGDQTRDIELRFGAAQWLPAQSHSGKNTGETPTHTILVELKHSTERNGARRVGPIDPEDNEKAHHPPG
jgi:quercetin dioxygenase-like cupin family protein